MESSDPQSIFKKVKEEAENYYKNLDPVLCPYLLKEVSFNIKGLNHVKFKDWNKTRLVSDQYLRLKFIKLAPEVLSECKTLQEYKETKCFERQKINKRWEHRAVEVKYYGFVAIKKGIRIKIVVKEIVGGNPYFWSIIPFWKTKKDPITGQIKKLFFDGDLETQ